MNTSKKELYTGMLDFINKNIPNPEEIDAAIDYDASIDPNTTVIFWGFNSENTSGTLIFHNDGRIIKTPKTVKVLINELLRLQPEFNKYLVKAIDRLLHDEFQPHTTRELPVIGKNYILMPILSKTKKCWMFLHYPTRKIDKNTFAIDIDVEKKIALKIKVAANLFNKNINTAYKTYAVAQAAHPTFFKKEIPTEHEYELTFKKYIDLMHLYGNELASQTLNKNFDIPLVEAYREVKKFSSRRNKKTK